MSEGLFNQPFVYCAVCHRQSTTEDPLHLTSCAHTLCSEHLNRSVCPVCQSREVMVIRLVENKQLPQDIRDLFQPVSVLLDNLYNASQFQYTGLVNQCRYYQEHCIKLREKCARQRQLLCQAKQELDSVAKLKTRIGELEAALARYENSTGRFKSHESSVFSAMKPPDTVDLTADGSDDMAAQDDEQSFVRKLKSTSSLRNKLQRQFQPLRGVNQSVGLAGESLASEGAIAESTQLGRVTSSPNNYHDKRFESPLIKSTLDKNWSLGINKEPGIRRGGTMTQSQFPSALNKLRIVKRNNTFSDPSRSSRGTQGLTPNMRSSSTVQTQTGLLMHGNPSRQRSSGSESLSGKGTNNRFRRIH